MGLRPVCRSSLSSGLTRRKEELAATKYLKSLGPAGIKPNGVELKAERRKPSGEKHCDIEDIPSLTGVLAHFRLH
jgi:hypothetical protein